MHLCTLHHKTRQQSRCHLQCDVQCGSNAHGQPPGVALMIERPPPQPLHARAAGHRHAGAATIYPKKQCFVLQLHPKNTPHAIFMQPLPRVVWQARMYLYAHGSRTWQQSCSHVYTAILLWALGSSLAKTRVFTINPKSGRFSGICLSYYTTPRTVL